MQSVIFQGDGSNCEAVFLHDTLKHSAGGILAKKIAERFIEKHSGAWRMGKQWVALS
jgi:hypothetical protein